MAIWQFDFYIIPKKNMTRDVCINSDEIINWRMQRTLIKEIDFLKKQKSWSSKISQYGKADETCIEFFYENGYLMDISCRLDLRSLSRNMLKKILDYIEIMEGLVFYEDKMYEPRLDEIIELIKHSRASRFCKNQLNYFEKINE